MLAIADDVWQLPLTPRDGINAYLIGDVLVDTGIKQSADTIAEDARGRQISAIALTHAHVDHAGAIRSWPIASARRSGAARATARRPRPAASCSPRRSGGRA